MELGRQSISFVLLATVRIISVRSVFEVVFFIRDVVGRELLVMNCGIIATVHIFFIPYYVS